MGVSNSLVVSCRVALRGPAALGVQVTVRVAGAAPFLMVKADCERVKSCSLLSVALMVRSMSPVSVRVIGVNGVDWPRTALTGLGEGMGSKPATRPVHVRR